MVSFQNVGKFILSGVDVHVPEGVIVGVIGASGAGKTTILKLACGLLACESGIVRTMGKDPVKCRKEISMDLRAYFSEHFYFDGDDTVLHQFELFSSFSQSLRRRKEGIHLAALQAEGDVNQRHKEQLGYRQQCCGRKQTSTLERERYWKEYEMLADVFQISDYVGKRVSQLSLGQRRRVELVSVLLGNARLLILDEPTNGLDGQGRQAFWKQLAQKKDSGATVLLSSHNMQEIGQLCDRIILLNRGKVLYYGDREELLHSYAPAARIQVQFAGRIPDMEDLPLLKYSVEGDRLEIFYNAAVVTAAEIVQHIIGQTKIIHINIVRQNLEDVVLQGKVYKEFHKA